MDSLESLKVSNAFRVKTAKDKVIVFEKEMDASHPNNIKHFGLMWSVLKTTGINVVEESPLEKPCGTLQIIYKYCFPLLLFINFLFLLSSPFSSLKFTFTSFVDIFLPFFPILLWVYLFKNKGMIKNLLTKLNSTALDDLSVPRCFTWIMNLSVVIIIFMPFVMVVIGYLTRKESSNQLENALRYCHEIIFPSIVTEAYCGICYLFVKQLKSYKMNFVNIPNVSHRPSLQALLKSYLEVVDALDIFQDSFSTPLFFLMCQNFSIVSVSVLDVMKKNKESFDMKVEMGVYLSYSLGIIGILTVMAAEIPLEMLRIKAVVLNIMSKDSNEEDLSCVEKQLQLLLKRDVLVVSVCNTFSLDRSFLIKALATIVAQVVILHQIITNSVED